MKTRIEKIKQSIPKIYFFEECFENSAFAPKILAELKLNLDSVEHSNLFNCSPILKKEQEVHLFRKFNYLKYRLIKNTEGFKESDKKPAPKPRPSTNLYRIGEKRAAELEYLIYRINDLKNLLIKSNMRLIVKPVSRYVAHDSFEREEFISNGYLHLMKAIDCFDYRLGYKFSTYCINALRTNLYRDSLFLRKNQSILENEEKVNSFVGKDLNCLSEINYEYNKKIVNEILDYLKNNKKQRHAEILKMTFGINCDRLLQREIASKLKMSRTRIQQIRDEAFKMVEHIAYDPII